MWCVSASRLLLLSFLLVQISGFSIEGFFKLYWSFFHDSKGISDKIDTAVDVPIIKSYKEVREEDWNINFKQYASKKVVRVSSPRFFETFNLIRSSKQDIPHKLWGWSSREGYVDVELDEQYIGTLEDKLVNTIKSVNVEIMVDDLAQQVFETYPSLEDSLADELKINEILGNLEETYENKDEQEMKLKTFSEVFFKEYRPLDTIYSWLDLLEQTYPGYVQVKNIGKTPEGRDMKIVHVTEKDEEPHQAKKTIVLSGGVHAREWITVSTVLYVLYALLQDYDSNQDSIFRKIDFIFLPTLNPDGYEYTWTHDRLWRKNRQETVDQSCIGIDIDHSYDFHWTRSADMPCEDEYSGEEPFEAVESRLWTEYLNLTDSHHNIQGFIDLHSYAQEILYPYAFSCQQEPRDEENLIELAYGIAKVIRLWSGKLYQVLPACQDRDLDLIPDLGSGTALDYMYKHKAYWAYRLELRDKGNHGFLLPKKYIVPVGQEIFIGIEYFCNFILRD